MIPNTVTASAINSSHHVRHLCVKIMENK